MAPHNLSLDPHYDIYSAFTDALFGAEKVEMAKQSDADSLIVLHSIDAVGFHYTVLLLLSTHCSLSVTVLVMEVFQETEQRCTGQSLGANKNLSDICAIREVFRQVKIGEVTPYMLTERYKTW